MNLLMKKNLCVSAVSCLLMEKKKWAGFVSPWLFSLSSVIFFSFRYGALFICYVDSSRSACHQGVFGNCHQGISLHVGKLDGLVCRVHRLNVLNPALSLYLQYSISLRCFYIGWSTPVNPRLPTPLLKYLTQTALSHFHNKGDNAKKCCHTMTTNVSILLD